jgi:integrase
MQYLPYDAGRGVRRLKVPRQNKARSLTNDEVRDILNLVGSQGNSDINVLFNCLFYLGLRAHEAANLKVSSFDFDRDTVEVIGKGSKLRVLGVSKNLKALLIRHIILSRLSKKDYLISSRNTPKDKPVTIQHINRIFKAKAKEAGVDTEGIKSHSGRVTAINFLLDSDISLRDAANFAGHSDVSTTRKYDRKSQDKIIQTSKIINF